MKKKLLILSCLFFTFFYGFSQVAESENVQMPENKTEEVQSLGAKMDQYTQKKKAEWNFNPFKKPETDKYFSSWADPYAYNSSILLGTITNAKELYDKPAFKMDKISFFYNPQLATSVEPLALSFDEGRHRLGVGIGFLWNGSFAMYGGGASQLYGTSFLFSSIILVNPTITYIYDNKLQVQLFPIRHVCYHMGGDILGDKTLYDLENGDEFRDVGFEQTGASVSYRWGWFNFYSGITGAITNFYKSNFVNLVYFYGGTEMRVPIYGELNAVLSVHVGVNYDRISKIQRSADLLEYKLLSHYEEATPVFALGVGIEVHDWILGMKYDYARSRQMYAYEHMESKIGFSAMRHW